MIAVFDTETTGLTFHPSAPLSRQPKIIEFGAALLSDSTGEIVEEMNIIINPGEEISPTITKITGLTNDDLKGAQGFSAWLGQISRFFEKAHTVMAHNLPFDKALLFYELERIGGAGFPWPRVEICTVGLYKEMWGRNPKLTELYQHVIGKPLEQTHRALDDVKALCEIIQKEGLWNFHS